MKKVFMAMVVLLFCGFISAGSVNAESGWSEIKDSNGIKLYQRAVAGTDLMEYMAVTTFDDKMEVIGEALRDVPKYTQWLSDCESARVEKKYDRNTYVIYILQNPFMIQKRDIVLKNDTLYDYENGLARVTFACTDEVKVPVDSKIVRITQMNGLFQMEYIGRGKTKFIYKLKVDPGGDIPKKVAYSVMKYYPFNSLKELKKVVKDKKYAEIARGSDDEKQITTRSFSEASVRKIFGETMLRVVKNKAVMTALLDQDTEGIRNIATSGSSYDTIEKTARALFSRYIEKTVPDKKAADSLKNNTKLHADVTYLVQTANEGEKTTVDDIIARYNK